MPRTARIAIPGVPHHVTQRGNNRQTVFFNDDDRRLYLALLSEESGRHGVEILAWCLMDNHVHLVAVPLEPESLARGLGRTHFRYAQTLNRRRRRSGHLWQNRFFSCPVQGDHFWRAMRYVERNPVRARIVRRAWTYPWSSAAAHCGLGDDPAGLVDLERWRELARGRDWKEELSRRETQEEAEALRRCTQTGRPLADPAFVEEMERKLGRRLAPRPVGRPRKDRNGELTGS